MTRVLFVTRGGPYDDEYIEGNHEMTWKGQFSGRRDNLVTCGTRVWYRNDKKHRYFKLIGTVRSIELLSAGNPSQKIPSTYKLQLDVHDVQTQRVVQRAPGDKKTHQSILRAEGYSEDIIASAGGWPHGIY